jgi:uncharacterized phage protein (TIGR02220 family)
MPKGHTELRTLVDDDGKLQGTQWHVYAEPKFGRSLKRRGISKVEPVNADNRSDDKERTQNEAKVSSGQNELMDEVREIIDHLNEVTGRRFRAAGVDALNIKARLREEDVTVEGIKQMISRQWEQWKGKYLSDKTTPLREFVRPSTLFKSENFNNYYSAKDLPIERRSSLRDLPYHDVEE